MKRVLNLIYLVLIISILLALSVNGQATNKTDAMKLENSKTVKDSYNFNVSLICNINLFKGVSVSNINVIKAFRKAIFDSWVYAATDDFRNFTYSKKSFITIFKVIKKGDTEWNIEFRESEKSPYSIDPGDHSEAIITKNDEGIYDGKITMFGKDIIPHKIKD